MNTDRDYAKAKALAHVQRAQELMNTKQDLAFGLDLSKFLPWKKQSTQPNQSKRPELLSAGIALDNMTSKQQIERFSDPVSEFVTTPTDPDPWSHDAIGAPTMNNKRQ